MGSKFVLINLGIFFFLSISTAALSTIESVAQQQQGLNCVYTVFVKTGNLPFAETDSKISLTVFNDAGDTVKLGDLEAWGGAMGKGYNYYEKGNLDVFTGNGPCLSRPVCGIEIVSDGGRFFHGWYLDYLAVSTTRPGQTECSQTQFNVNQWIIWPVLSVRKDNCPKKQLPLDTPLPVVGLASS